MTTLQDILNKLDDVTLLVQDLPAQFLMSGANIVVVGGLSDIAENLGLIQAGEFRTGNGELPGNGFSGVRIAYPSMTYDSEEWHIVGINNDTLQFGLRASDGAALAGGGKVVIDANGIEIEAGGTSFITWEGTVGTAAYILGSETISGTDRANYDIHANPNGTYDDTLFRILASDTTTTLTIELDTVGEDISLNNLFASGTITLQATTINIPNGLVVGSPTGGDKGAGTINATAVYDDNVLLTDHLWDLWVDGEMRDEDAEKYPDARLWSIDETQDFVVKHRHFPEMPSRNDEPSVGEMVSGLLATIENQQMQIFELNQRLQKLESNGYIV